MTDAGRAQLMQVLLVLGGLACWAIACIPRAAPAQVELVALGAWMIGVVKRGPGHIDTSRLP